MRDFHWETIKFSSKAPIRNRTLIGNKARIAAERKLPSIEDEMHALWHEQIKYVPPTVYGQSTGLRGGT